MTDVAASPLPSFGTAFGEQLRVVGLAIRREGMVLAAGLAVLFAIILIDTADSGENVDFEPFPALMLLAAGALLPLAVWKGERVFGSGPLWTLPVDRRRHALIKVLAGGVWLLVAAVGVHLWLLALMLATGGTVGEVETRMLAGPGGGADLTPVRWTTQAWEWAAPFSASLTAYLFGSALVLGLQYPLRWVAGAVAVFVAVVALEEAEVASHLVRLVLDSVIQAPLGLDAALGGGLEREMRGTPSAPGSEPRVLVVWYVFPSLQRYAPAALLWLALGALALWLAASRHRER